MSLVTKLMDEHNAVVQYAQESHHKDGFLDGMKKAIEIVKNHSGWLSTDCDLLREYANKDVLIYTKTGSIIVATFVSDDNLCVDDDGKEYAQSHWFVDEWDSFWGGDEVKYWYPLPNPPEE